MYRKYILFLREDTFSTSTLNTRCALAAASSPPITGGTSRYRGRGGARRRTSSTSGTSRRNSLGEKRTDSPCKTCKKNVKFSYGYYDSCNGDSGGPAVMSLADEEGRRRDTIVGVVSR